MPTHLALLKGINVGGRHLVKMADLKDLFSNLGFDEVSTLLQSGNVVFKSSSHSEPELEALLQSAFSKRFGFEVEFVVRQSGQLKNAILNNHFSEEAKADPSHLLVHFFRQAPNLESLAAVQAAIKGPERLYAFDKDVFVVYPDGIGTSTVTRTPGWNKLMGGSTARNWNTILKLAALLD